MPNGISKTDANGKARGGPSQNCGKKATSKKMTKKQVARVQTHAASAKPLSGKGKYG
jgi:hypothetical protein|tara:strand:- start:3146 stop:3316 length:171 start_codon:yes stop_codon:yes gene_type:complete